MASRRLTISLELESYQQLNSISESEDRSLSWLIGLAVRDFLRRHSSEQQLELPLPPQGSLATFHARTLSSS